MAITKIDGTRQIAASSITNASQNFGTPSASTDVAIKSYVDALAQGLSVKPSARLATTAALSPTNTYTSGVLTATGVGILTVDGFATVLNDYILVMNDAGLKNGLYKVTTEGTAGVAYVLTRALEMDISAEFTGAFVFIEQGTANGSSGWVCTTIAPTVGSTSIAFTQFSGAGEITAGAGMTKTGNTLDVVGTTNRITVAADSIDIGTDVVTLAAAQALTNKDMSGVGNTWPTFNQNTSGSAAKWTTARNLAGNSVDGSGNVAFANKFVVQGTTDAGLTGAQFLGALGTGIVLNTTTTGVLSIAANTDLPVGDATHSGAVPTPPNDTAKWLRGDLTWQVLPAPTVYQRSTTVSGTQDGANKIFTIGNTLLSGSEQVFINGQLLMPGASNDYVYNGTTTVTFQAGFTAPASTDVLRVYGAY